MKFQISFDALTIEQEIEMAKKLAQFADILEIGTLPLLKYGVSIVERFKKEIPDKIILADCKIVDRGRDIVSIYAQAGADWISVMGGTSRDVVHGACSKAHDVGKKVILDLIDANSPGQTALEAKSLGADALLFHQPYDDGGSLTILEQWEMVRGNTDLPIFISAKIDRGTIDRVLELNPDGIVVGKAIMQSDDPIAEAQFFYDKCKNR
jgi:3-hexulose-6-phosphate synthase